MATAMLSVTGSHCPRCTEIGTKICRGCMNIKYCSAECQYADWATHKVLCSTFKGFQERPSEGMRRAIYFDPAQGKPRFTWTTFELINEEDDGEDGNSTTCWEYPDFQPLMADDSFCRGLLVEKNAWSSIGMGYGIKIYYDDNFGANYSSVNEAIRTATEGKNAVHWKGPLFAVCGAVVNDTGNLVKIADMDMKAYANVVAFLTDYQNYSPMQIARKGPKAEGVTATCQGERRLSGAGDYKVVKIPASHQIFDGGGDLSAISERVGIPLLCKRSPANKQWKQLNDHRNQVTHMHRFLDPNSQMFAWSPPERDPGVGNVLIAKRDRQPLSTETVDAFGDFCQWHVVAYAEWMAEAEEYDNLGPNTGLTACKKVFLNEMTPEKWATYLEQWLAVKSSGTSFSGRQSFLRPLTDDGVAELLAEDPRRMGLTEHDSEKLTWKLLRRA